MLGVSAGITAGAVISGAYLGDKLSPLSETTVLTAQMVEVPVYEHNKRQAWTSVPAFGLAFVLFLLIGLFWGPAPTDVGDTASELTALGDIFWITPLNLLPLVLLSCCRSARSPRPWPCGAFMGGVLGVPTLVYLPFCFFNIASPMLSVTYGLVGFKIEKVEPADDRD